MSNELKYYKRVKKIYIDNINLYNKIINQFTNEYEKQPYIKILKHYKKKLKEVTEYIITLEYKTN